ncbi:hypothetical protein, partial [Pseudomonas sp. MWU12-2115]|uniref:hypothetical protein n=1 Tax=Pseudomonas sp. MWU12-2115 TaxID=2071713 RepID=UPI0011BF5253
MEVPLPSYATQHGGGDSAVDVQFKFLNQLFGAFNGEYAVAGNQSSFVPDFTLGALQLRGVAYHEIGHEIGRDGSGWIKTGEYWDGYAGQVSLSVTIQKRLPNNQLITVAQGSYTGEWDDLLKGMSNSASHDGVTQTINPTRKDLVIQTTSSDIKRVLLLTRPLNQVQGWQVINVPQLAGGQFALDWT